jgi:hypothetical protein
MKAIHLEIPPERRELVLIRTGASLHVCTRGYIVVTWREANTGLLHRRGQRAQRTDGGHFALRAQRVSPRRDVSGGPLEVEAIHARYFVARITVPA